MRQFSFLGLTARGSAHIVLGCFLAVSGSVVAAPTPTTAFQNIITSFEAIDSATVTQPQAIPDDITNDSFNSDGKIRLFIERDDFSVDESFPVSLAPTPSDFGIEYDDELANSDTLAPTNYNSTIILRDGGGDRQEAIINFADPILGISIPEVNASGQNNFQRTTDIFGVSSVSYPGNTFQSSNLEIIDANSIRVSLRVSTSIDFLRVLTGTSADTTSVPAPSGGLLALMGALAALPRWRLFVLSLRAN